MNAEKTSIIKMFIKDADNANAKRALVKNIFMNALLSNDVEILEIFVRNQDVTKYLDEKILQRCMSANVGAPYVYQIYKKHQEIEAEKYRAEQKWKEIRNGIKKKVDVERVAKK